VFVCVFIPLIESAKYRQHDRRRHKIFWLIGWFVWTKMQVEFEDGWYE